MKLITVIIGLIALVSVGTGLAAAFSGKNYITSYLKKNTTIFTYETSITGNNKQKADVYRSAYDLDTTVKSILSGIQGKTEDVQQNTEDGDNSVAILTKDEYCLVYESEDDEVLVQVSSRKYAYTTDKAPYHAHSYTHHYYRRYYYSRGYQNDSGSFGKYTSPYSSYDGDTLTKNNVDIYDTYSSNIRQSSVNRRSSSGGGLSSGK